MRSGFYQEPSVAFTITIVALDENPFSFEFFSIEKYVKFPLPVIPVHQLVGSNIPNHHGAAAVFSFWNRAFESGVFHRVIFRGHRQPFIFRSAPHFET